MISEFESDDDFVNNKKVIYDERAKTASLAGSARKEVGNLDFGHEFG